MSILDSLKKLFTNDKPSDSDEPVQAESKQEELPPEQYVAALEAQRAEKDHYFKHSPYSPIEDRQNFTGLNYYPPNPAFHYVLPLRQADRPEALTIQTNTGEERTYYRIGTVEFEVEGEPVQLAIYKSDDHDELFLPFRDATSGKETYGAGRYLEPAELPGGQILVDFNLAYNPFCAYSEDYSCPLPPLENWLKVPIRAGEKAYKANRDH